ncbi:hypothetical protein SGPA1_21921 [Streptomyces misionensis JCM 4497]
MRRRQRSGQPVPVAGGHQVDGAGAGDDQTVQDGLVAVAVHERDLVAGDAVVAHHAVGGGVAVQHEVRAVRTEDAGRVALGLADRAGVLEKGTQLADRDRQVRAEQALAVVVEELPADRRLQERDAAGVRRGVPGVLVRLVEAAERLEEGRQDRLAVGTGGGGHPPGDEGGSVLERPDIAGDHLGDPQRKPLELPPSIRLVRHHEQHRQILEPLSDKAEHRRATAVLLSRASVAGQVPGDHGTRETGLRPKDGPGVLGPRRPPHLKTLALQFLADPGQLGTCGDRAFGHRHEDCVVHHGKHSRRWLRGHLGPFIKACGDERFPYSLVSGTRRTVCRAALSHSVEG